MADSAEKGQRPADDWQTKAFGPPVSKLNPNYQIPIMPTQKRASVN
jgi:hypothetical protein